MVGEHAHERQATYLWARRFSYLRTIEEYRCTIFFPLRRTIVDSPRNFDLNLWLLDVNDLLLSYFSEHPTHLHVFARQRFSACKKGNRMNVRIHINAHFACYLAFSFYYIYSNVWIFKSKQANTLQHYISIHTIVKICNDNCSKSRQHRTSIERPDLVSIWSKRSWT